MKVFLAEVKERLAKGEENADEIFASIKAKKLDVKDSTLYRQSAHRWR
jgi:hypothetical protein